MGYFPAFLIIIAGALALCLVVYAIYRIVTNLNAPQTVSRAIVLGKRQEVSGGAGNSSVSTSHYVTFELEGGERREIGVGSGDYGKLFEGDRGRITMQGTWYRGFSRER